MSQDMVVSLADLASRAGFCRGAAVRAKTAITRDFLETIPHETGSSVEYRAIALWPDRGSLFRWEGFRGLAAGVSHEVCSLGHRYLRRRS